MKLYFTCDGGTKILAENIVECAVVVDDGLTLAIGSTGISIVITPAGGKLPGMLSSFTWEMVLQRMLKQ